MRQKRMHIGRVGGFSMLLALLSLACSVISPACAESWHVILGEAPQPESGLALAVADLQSALEKVGASVTVHHDAADPGGNLIVVGNSSRNGLTASFVAGGAVRLVEIPNPEGFGIRPVKSEGRRVLVISGGGPAGEVYGVYWLWDRVRVAHAVPELDVRREPAFYVRSGGGTSIEDMNASLRYTVNWVSYPNSNALVPWESEPLRSQNEENRAEARRLIEYAHALHMKFFTDADEFSYHPDVLAKYGATLSPADPALWNMLQDKYRSLLKALPELDGIRIRTGELTRVLEPLKPYDVMHEPEVGDWPLERRYQTFVKKMHEVVVGESGKLYYHRTWVTNATEQHSNPDVYKAIFTDEVPVENLFLSPYLTRGDRWFYQPINATFNLTPHKMLVLLAPMNYHEDGSTNIFPTYPGLYFREGLDQIWRGKESNIAGSQMNIPKDDGWWSNELTAYAAFRMAWDPLEDPRVIAEDFASIHFGKRTAKIMGEAIMLSGEAYKNGLYIKPVAEAIEWNTLPQLRLTTFPVQGFPEIDRGKAHVNWLRDTIYTPCKGRIDEALKYLDKGLGQAQNMQSLGRAAAPDFDDPEVARQVGDSLELARQLIAVNIAYTKACFAYFGYAAAPGPETEKALEESLSNMVVTVGEFRAVPGFDYKLYGIDQLRKNILEMLVDREEAQRRLAAAPDKDEVSGLIAEHQAQDVRILQEHADAALKVLHWQGMVDGKDILRIQGDKLTIEHVMADPIHSDKVVFAAPLPAKAGTVVVKDIRSGEVHPFVLTQPTKENSYTAEVYLFDPGPGYAMWELEVYFLDRDPVSLGIDPTWET
ncbi:MAG: hypothetical protein IT364_23685 [Candidatus Hydrogenedentes bacterium]|nr:hypothetical protein [Candidatus Hydrogenedentota bacterium]